MTPRKKSKNIAKVSGYDGLLSGISDLLDAARRTAARKVNGILTATYWEIGRRIVEHEQGGQQRAEYGEQIIDQLAADLTRQHGRGFSRSNVFQMRGFFLAWEIFQTVPRKLEARAKFDADKIVQTLSGQSQALIANPASQVPAPISRSESADIFPLSWSHYVRLLSVEKPHARAFYEAEAIRGGWSVRQLDRQIGTQLFERTSQSKRQSALLAKAQIAKPEDAVSAQDEIRDPYLLEFLNLKDEYSESELEDALIRHLEWFLLELGNGFTFVARQKRIRIGTEWYRIDLVLYHRVLHCLVLVDLKRGKFTHADAGQMNLYLNYAQEHLTFEGESDPIGIILCSDKDDAVVKYATGGINAKVFASKYLTELPDEDALRAELITTQETIARRIDERTSR
jgi:predicted nuclease of restriction endonuclease-like (RecB) superfamily